MAALRICCSQPPQAPRASRPFRKRTTTSSSSRRWSAHRHQRQQHAAAHRRSGTYERMDRAGNGRADFAGTGLAAVATAMSYLLHTVCGRNDPGAGGTPLDPFTTWQVILALGLMSGGLLLVMYGVRAPGARPPALVRRAADAAGALLWYAAGPERLLPLTLLLVLEAWFDFF